MLLICRVKWVVLPVILFLVLVTYSEGGECATGKRIYGEDRYETSVEISKSEWETSSTVLLARGDDFPDALTGTPLAYKKDAPVLLTRFEEIPGVVEEEIKRLEPEEVIILGEEMAVSLDVEYRLMEMGISVDRIGGMDRYETAARVAERIYEPEKAIIAGGSDFPDALVVSSYAAPKGIPVLLSRSDEIPEATRRAMEDTMEDIEEVIVVGGESAVGPEVVEQLPHESTRIAGEDRYETAAAIVRELELPMEKVFIATGRDFADALTGSALSSRKNASMLLVDQQGVPRPTLELIEESLVKRFFILGGKKAVSDEIAAELEIEVKESIRLGWQFTYLEDDKYIKDPPSETGYNIYAPTAYKIEGTGHNVSVGRDSNVMDKARENDYKTWVTVQAFGRSKVEEMFRNPGLQTRLIEELLEKAEADNVDGINIDFENLGTGSFIRDGFTAFMDELYQECRERDITLSVAVTRPGNTSWSACYDHGALSEVSDYVVLMAYDEHWGSSPVAGPVASLSWVEGSIKDVLDRGVPPEELVLGVPFYSRIWKTVQERQEMEEDTVKITAGAGVNVRPEPNTEKTEFFTAPEGYFLNYLDKVEGEVIEGNKYWYQVELEDREEVGYVTAKYSQYLEKGEVWEVHEVKDSFPVGLETGRQILDNYDENRATSYYTTNGETRHLENVEFYEDEGLTLVEYNRRGRERYTYKIWPENYDSLRQRHELKEKYDLAGIAAWSLDWQDSLDDVWLEMYGEK